MVQGNGLREYLRQQATTTPTGAAVEVALRPSSLAHRASTGAATAGAAIMATQRQEPDFKALLASWGASACGVLMCAGWPPDPDFTEEKLLELLPRLWQEAVDNGFRPRLPESVDDLTKGLQFTFARYDKKKEKQQQPGQQQQQPAPQQQQHQQQQPAPQQQQRQQQQRQQQQQHVTQQQRRQLQLIQQQRLAQQQQLAQQQRQQHAAALRPTMQPVAQALPHSAGQAAVHPAVIAHQHSAVIPNAPVGSASLSAWLQGSQAAPVLMTGPAGVPLVRGQPVAIAASSNVEAFMPGIQPASGAGAYSSSSAVAAATAAGGVQGFASNHPSRQQQQQQLRAQPQLASAPTVALQRQQSAQTVALQRQQSATSSGQRQPSGGSAAQHQQLTGSQPAAAATADRCSVLFVQALAESATPVSQELVRALVSVLDIYSQQPQMVGKWKLTNAQLCQAAVSLCMMYRQEEQQALARCTPTMLLECLAQLVWLQVDVDTRVSNIKQKLGQIAAGKQPAPAQQAGSTQQHVPDAGVARDAGAASQPMPAVPAAQGEGEQGAELCTVQASELEVELLLLYRKRPKLMADFERFLDGAVNGAHTNVRAAAAAAAGGPGGGTAAQAALPQPRVAAEGKSFSGEQPPQESEPGELGRPMAKRALSRTGERQHRQQLCQRMQDAMAQLAQQLAGES